MCDIVRERENSIRPLIHKTCTDISLFPARIQALLARQILTNYSLARVFEVSTQIVCFPPRPLFQAYAKQTVVCVRVVVNWKMIYTSCQQVIHSLEKREWKYPTTHNGMAKAMQSVEACGLHDDGLRRGGKKGGLLPMLDDDVQCRPSSSSGHNY